ncbi:flavin reductase family protein [Pseudomonas typographi]|uniref:Flavin reductase n=1 Tax=Pseudomonas typographi TaxID=2715964 RepID=A0ABR7Z3A9_9PSED|nr:flavin reductase family protein [Pseudomonas typographi]MBD1599872.1 flavin reductase [Pseudomonas typographi]
MKQQLSRTLTPSYCDIGAFINAMGGAVTGVGIVATDGPGGRFGVTVSSMASVSAEPPMLLVCVRASSPSAQAVKANGRFTLNLLHAAQAHLADAFAGRPRTGAAYDFSDPAWVSDADQAPRLEGACASFVCELESAQQAGSHLILIGTVSACYHQPQPPLLYCGRRYGVPASF